MPKLRHLLENANQCEKRVRKLTFRGLNFRWVMHALPYILTTFFIVFSTHAITGNTIFDTPIHKTDFPHSKPDLIWRPQIFEPHIDPNARYIDYENGNDNYPGTKLQPWKHHPWDKSAKNHALETKKISTYYFKRGVTYRGTLVASESGTQSKPIRLTIDPDWGAGDAILTGSAVIKNKWHLCTPNESKVLPPSSQNKTWCIDTELKNKPMLLWSIKSNILSRIHLARTPNWNLSNPDDPRSEWFELEDVILELTLQTKNKHKFHVGDRISSNGVNDRIIRTKAKSITVETRRPNIHVYKINKFISNGHTKSQIKKVYKGNKLIQRLIDSEHLTNSSPSYYKNATVHVEPSFIPQPVSSFVLDYNPEDSSLTVNLKLTTKKSPVKKSRYFLDGLPQFLDTPGEYAFKIESNNLLRLYLRLPLDADPNLKTIDIASRYTIIQIKNKMHIEISGLKFQASNQLSIDNKHSNEAHLYASAVQVRGSTSHIDIHHCKFDNLPAGIIAYPSSTKHKSIIDYIKIQDNIFIDIDGSAIAMGNGQNRKKYSNTASRLIHADIRRNWFNNIGMSTLSRLGSVGTHGDAIQIAGGELITIANNHVNRVGGSGINIRLGNDKYSRGNLSFPLLRGLVHHNKITNSLLTRYDAGGILGWNGGPLYIYNNISANPVGYRHNVNAETKKNDSIQKSGYGMGIYLDSNFKAYVFNNIIWGVNNDMSKPIYNAAALNEAMGFNHMVFNNTLFRFAAGFHKGMVQHNRNLYLGNLLLDMSHKFILHKPLSSSIEYDSIGFKNNIFFGQPNTFGQLGTGKRSNKNLSFTEWKTLLINNKSLQPETGELTKSDVVINAEQHDFRLQKQSPAIGKGVKTFVPWALSRVVGEWNFYQTQTQPTKIFGENININSEWVDRLMLDQVPRNDLICQNAGLGDFSKGPLENWIDGALQFDGKRRYCSISNETLISRYTWKTNYREKLSGEFPANQRDTVNVDKDNFLIETVLSVNSTSKHNGILQKNGARGYELSINKQGRLELSLNFGNTSAKRISAAAINDNQWHHIIIEVNRDIPQGISFYIDGILSNGDWKGSNTITESLSNSNDFLVGKSDTGYFSGKIDYLRFSKDTLSNAETSIEELYEWEFNGPFLKDFSGKSTNGLRLNAGAVE